ncbi:DUF29 family protein [Nostoc sp. ChiQUE01b]
MKKHSRNHHENARNLASGETNLPLSTFPNQCLYLFEVILSALLLSR